MFILRKLTKDGGELNFALGNSYGVTLKEQHPERFEETLKVYGSVDDPKIYGFLSCGGGQLLALFRGQRNYIMTENGATFDNLSER